MTDERADSLKKERLPARPALVVPAQALATLFARNEP